MTTPFLRADVAREEGGPILKSYRDSVGVWTCGYGSISGVTSTTRWTAQRCEDQLDLDLAHAISALDAHLSWWRTLSAERQDVMVQMAFQLGIGGLLQFTTTLAAMKRGDYAAAADGMLASKWARQTPARAKREAYQMRTGVRYWVKP